MNIVVLNDSCEVDGGAAMIAIEDAREMAKRGHRVIFFSACGTPPVETGGIEWISLGQNTILDEANRLLAMWRGLWNRPASSALKSLLLTLPRDGTVVHLHSWSKALSGSVVALTHQLNYRLVCTLHDYFLICPNGGLYDYPTRQVCMLQPMSMKCIARNCDSRARAHKVWRVVRQLVWRYLAHIPSGFDRMIAVSDFSARKIKERWPVQQAAIDVIENAPQVRRSVLRPAAERKSIIYAGRVAAEKGVDLYLEACGIADVSAEVWGDGPVISQLKVAWPNAYFAGWVQPAVLRERLEQALALVVPSLWYETYGMVVAEAAAAGVAVIVSDHGAPATLVEDRVTGLHFRVGNAADLAEKITLLNRDPGLAYQMGKTAYDRFWQDCAGRRDRRVEQIELCYQRLLGLTA